MKKHLPIIIFLTIFFVLTANKLIFHPTPFYDWDESIYIQAGKEMIQQKQFITPLWQGTNWLDKPPFIPLIYGVITKLTFFSTPEISTRLFNLIISIIVLSFVYIFYNLVLKNRWLSTLTVAITAFTPLFMQRAQTVNLDIFILVGWLGYILFFNNFFASLFFLFIAVMGKSLIGFYPVVLICIYYLFKYFKKEIKKKELIGSIKIISIQVMILSLWYIIMFLIFGKAFFWQHIIESHFRRVTSSIEFHFGQRTYYITLALEQMGYFFYLGIIGGIMILYNFFKNKISTKETFFSLFLLPWFIFLNLTKTKIFWYLYPAIPLFAFLSIIWIKQINQKSLKIFFELLLISILFYQSFVKQNVLTTVYSKPEPYYNLSLYAKNNCQTLNLLINKTSRESFATLDKLGLLITTTKWWGDHPSMIYYFGKKIYFYYDTETFNKSLQSNGCFVIDKGDIDYLDKSSQTKQFGDYYLIKK